VLKKKLQIIDNEYQKECKVRVEVEEGLQKMTAEVKGLEEKCLRILESKQELQSKKEAMIKEFGKDTELKLQYEALVKEIKDSIDKAELELEAAKGEHARADMDSKNSALDIATNRKKYQQIINNYNFNFDIKEIDFHSFQNECRELAVEKKVKRETDIEALLEFEVDCNLQRETLEEVQNLEDEIKIRHTFESERLQNTHPNMMAINHFRDKVLALCSSWSTRPTRRSSAR